MEWKFLDWTKFSKKWPDEPFRNHLPITEPNSMAMENYTAYQQKIIKSFYKNRDDVAFQRAQELLTDLYLTEGKKREKVWESLFTNLERIGVPADQLEHIKKERKPELVAKLLEKKL